MRNCILLTLIVFVISCKEEKKETKPVVATYSIAQMMDNERVFGGDFSNDNSKILVTSNSSGIYNMYTIPTNGGKPIAESKSDSASIFAISYFPKDDRILFRKDNNGDEIFKLYMKNSDSIIALTPEENARAIFQRWVKDKNAFYYQSNKRDKRYMDLYLMSIENKLDSIVTNDSISYHEGILIKDSLIYENTEGYSIDAIGTYDSILALSKAINTNDSDLFLYHLYDKTNTKINRKKSKNNANYFSKDGSYFYYTTDHTNEFSYLMQYTIATNEKVKVLVKKWDITGSYLTETGKYQVIYSNEDAKNTIEIIETKSGNHLELPKFNDTSITNVNFSRDEKKLSFYLGGSHTPSDLYSFDIKTQKTVKLTTVLNKDIAVEDLVKAKVVRYKSFDGVEIPAIYYLPKQASAKNKVPALVWVHGGPGGQSRQNFNSLIQYLVNHGYAVLAVNNRGSSGYGKTFYNMDNKNHGEKDLLDCIEGKNWLAKQPEIDANKIGIQGGSYGGYMTMAALTFTPNEFEVGVNLYGVTNWIRTLRNIPPWWESYKTALYEELGDPNTIDSVRLRKISPLFFTDKIVKPFMVLQGEKDPRVLKIESDEIVANARKNNVPVTYVLFEDEGHGFVKKENQILAYSRILQFLDLHLKKEIALKDDALVPKEMPN